MYASENVIAEYVKNHGKRKTNKYKQLYFTLGLMRLTRRSLGGLP
jgi:hypothetical protein